MEQDKLELQQALATARFQHEETVQRANAVVASYAGELVDRQSAVQRAEQGAHRALTASQSELFECETVANARASQLIAQIQREHREQLVEIHARAQSMEHVSAERERQTRARSEALAYTVGSVEASSAAAASSTEQLQAAWEAEARTRMRRMAEAEEEARVARAHDRELFQEQLASQRHGLVSEAQQAIHAQTERNTRHQELMVSQAREVVGERTEALASRDRVVMELEQQLASLQVTVNQQALEMSERVAENRKEHEQKQHEEEAEEHQMYSDTSEQVDIRSLILAENEYVPPFPHPPAEGADHGAGVGELEGKTSGNDATGTALGRTDDHQTDLGTALGRTEIKGPQLPEPAVGGMTCFQVKWCFKEKKWVYRGSTPRGSGQDSEHTRRATPKGAPIKSSLRGQSREDGSKDRGRSSGATSGSAAYRRGSSPDSRDRRRARSSSRHMSRDDRDNRRRKMSSRRRRDAYGFSSSSSNSSDSDSVPSVAQDSDAQDTETLTEYSEPDPEDEDLKRALKKEHSEIKLPQYPTILQLNNWKLRLLERVLEASARTDEYRVTRWLKQTEKPGIKLRQLEDPGKNYRTLDRSLAAAIQKIVSGDLSRRIDLLKNRMLSGRGTRTLMSGRQMLLLMYRSFRVNRHSGPMHSVVDLSALRWRGDSYNNIESFRNDWEHLVENLPHRAPRYLMAEVLLAQMSNSTVLRNKVERYRKRYPIQKKPYHKLLEIMDRWLSDQAEARNRRNLMAEQAKRIQAAAPAAPAPKGKAKAEPKSKAKAKADAKAKAKADEKARADLVAAATRALAEAAAPALSRGKGKGKGTGKGKSTGKDKGQGKGKGNGKKGDGKSRNPSQTPQKLCAFFQIGECRDRNCKWKHEKARDSDEIARLRALREKNPKSRTPTGKKPCYHWEYTGKCDFGDKCQFAHTGQPGSKKGQKGLKGKGRSKSPGKG